MRLRLSARRGRARDARVPRGRARARGARGARRARGARGARRARGARDLRAHARSAHARSDHARGRNANDRARQLSPTARARMPAQTPREVHGAAGRGQ